MGEYNAIKGPTDTNLSQPLGRRGEVDAPHPKHSKSARDPEEQDVPRRCVGEYSSEEFVDKEFSLSELVDTDLLQRLLRGFFDFTGLNACICDHVVGAPLFASYRPICELFHRAVEASAVACQEHLLKLTGSVQSEGEIRTTICPHGLVEVVIPVMVRGKPIASIAVGQAFVEEPDIARFSELAEKYGYDRDRYLQALRLVPVISEAYLNSILPFLREVASLLARLAVANAQLKEPGATAQEDIRLLKEENAALGQRVAALETMVNAIPDIAVLVDDRGKVLAHNEAVAGCLGRASADLQGRSIFDLLPEEDASTQRRRLEEAVRTGEALRWQDQKHAGLHEYRLFPVPDANARVKRAAVFAREITDSARVLRRLRESERRLSTLIGNLPGLAYRCLNEKDWPMEFVSEGCLELTGYSPAQLVEGGEMGYGDLIHPDDRELVWQGVQKAVSRDEPFQLEYRIRTASGEEKWVWEKGSAVSTDAHGRLALEGFITDITESKKAAQRSKEQLNFMASLVEAIPGPVFYKNTDHMYLGCNEAFAQFIGLPKEKIVGRSVYDVSPKQLADRYRAMDEALFKNPGSQVYESAVKSADGSMRHVIFHKATFSDSSGEVAGLIGAILDITKRKHAEKELSEREELLAHVLAASPVGIGRLEERRLSWCNQALLDMFGFTDETDYQGKSTRILFASDEEFERVGRSVYELSPPRITEADAKFVRKDGTLFDGHIKISSPDESHPQKGTIFAISDISQRKLAEERLRQSEERYRTLFDQSTDAIFFVHPEGEILDANRAASDLLGTKPEDLIGSDVQQFYVRPEDRETFRTRIEQSGLVRDFEWRVKRSDGTERICLINSSVRVDENGYPMAYLGIVRDVTEQRDLEKQLRQAQKMESIATLASGIAHDFNNLLTIAAGYTELLLAEKTERSEGYDELQAISHASRRGADLVKRILTFTRRVETNPTPVNLNDEVRHAQKLLFKTIPKMIDIELRLEDELHAIFADASQIEQVILNLAVNAQHAMPRGGRLVFQTRNIALSEEFCKFHVEAQPGEFVLLTVSDSGHGMDRATCDRIFEPFFTTKKSHEGTGLGLAMLYGIVKGHGGFVTCDSTPGVGTTFKLYFPASHRMTKPDVAVSQEIPAFGSQTILVVDDEESIRDLADRILTKNGYLVLTASSGKEALEIYAERGSEVDLVLLDFVMPEMGGKQCLEELLNMNPNVRVVFVSGFAIDSDTRAELAERSEGFLRKPFMAADLLRTVRKAFEEG